jgi:hypothetical protein
VLSSTKKRRLEARGAIEVYRDTQGYICIKQMDFLGDSDQVILMGAVDIPIIIEWLEDLVKELESTEKS